MQRIINDPDFVVEDMLKGYVKAHGDLAEVSKRNSHVIKTTAATKGRVGIVTGGGSGHEPAFLGYVGKNMVDAAAIGEVFSSPPAQAFYDAFLEADGGKGVACLFGNYAGDNMNVKMAVQMAGDDGIEVKYLAANDDVASSPKDQKEKRHGIAGGLFMWKAGGARAALGGTLDEVMAAARKAVENTRSICIGLSACTIPAVGKPNFHIEEGKMEFGIGHHGEPGIQVEPLTTAKEIGKRMSLLVMDDLELKEGEAAAIIVSGLGATPLMELYLLYDEIEKHFSARGILIEKVYVGNYVTSLDMNGAALTAMRLDPELRELLEVPAITPAFHGP